MSDFKTPSNISPLEERIAPYAPTAMN
jgi:hypothetical protein